MRILQPDAVVADDTEAFAAVCNILWSEREMLELLLFKLVQENSILSSGSTRWLNRADAEVRAAVEQLRAAEILRAAEVESLALILNLPLETTLAQLADIAPLPWPEMLTQHRSALRALMQEIEAVAADNRRMLDAGSKAIRETLENLSSPAATFGAGGTFGASGTFGTHGNAAFRLRAPIMLDQQA
jgi:FlgN protein